MIASLALLVALAGTGYAALRLPANSVGTSQLRDRAVTGRKLDAGAVTAEKLGQSSVTPSKLLNEAVTTQKLEDSSVTTGKLENSAVTSTKLANAAVTSTKLAPGAITAAAVPTGAGVSITYAYGTVSVPAGEPLSAHVTCPAGSTVVGGGMTAGDPRVVLNDSAPFNSKSEAWTGGPSDSWGVYVTNTDATQSHVVGVYAICIVPDSVH